MTSLQLEVGLATASVRLPQPKPLRTDSPALETLTDLQSGRPVTVSQDERLEAALQRMIHAGVRLLFTTAADGALVGVVTSYDIQGEKPVRFLGSSDCLQDVCRWQDVRVRDIHTPVSRWPAVTLGALRQATVGEVLGVLGGEWTHVLVVERDAEGGWCVCGLISKAEIDRRIRRVP